MPEQPILTTLRFGIVTEVNDSYDTWRIKARTTNDNKTEWDEELPYYIPLLPKMLHIMPKKGELVLLLSMKTGDKDSSFGFYIGPIISQEDKMFYDSYDNAMKITETAIQGWDQDPRTKKDTVKPTLYPKDDDISIEGRKNTGIQLKDDEVRIKAGVKVVDTDGPKSNTNTPSFISLKYYPKNDLNDDGFMSTATIVADKINLLGTNTKDPATKEISITENTDSNATAEEKDNFISDNAMRKLLNQAHQLPYGDKLIEFLNLLKTAFAKHVHPFPTMAPCDDENMKAVANYDLEEEILSDNVRIN